MSEVIRSGYPDLMDLRIAAKEYFVDAFKQYPMPFESYFDVKDMGDGLGSFLKSSELGGVPIMPEVGESSDFPEATPVEGYDTTLTPLKYAQTIVVSLETQQDDPKGVFTNMEQQINAHYKSAVQRACVLASSIVNTGTSTVGPDGQYIFDTDHPTSPSNATTLSNLITTKLDAAGIAIKEIITKAATNGKDLAGNQIQWGRFLVVVPPALADNALRSCQAIYGTQFSIATAGAFSGVVGGISNPSPLQTGALTGILSQAQTPATVVVDPFLGSGYSGGSDVKWYFIAHPQDYKGTHSLRWIWRKRPQIINVSIDQDNQSLKIPFYMRCVGGAVGWRHAWASNGTA